MVFSRKRRFEREAVGLSLQQTIVQLLPLLRHGFERQFPLRGQILPTF